MIAAVLLFFVDKLTATAAFMLAWCFDLWPHERGPPPIPPPVRFVIAWLCSEVADLCLFLASAILDVVRPRGTS